MKLFLRTVLLIFCFASCTFSISAPLSISFNKYAFIFGEHTENLTPEYIDVATLAHDRNFYELNIGQAYSYFSGYMLNNNDQVISLTEVSSGMSHILFQTFPEAESNSEGFVVFAFEQNSLFEEFLVYSPNCDHEYQDNFILCYTSGEAVEIAFPSGLSLDYLSSGFLDNEGDIHYFRLPGCPEKETRETNYGKPGSRKSGSGFAILHTQTSENTVNKHNHVTLPNAPYVQSDYLSAVEFEALSIAPSGIKNMFSGYITEIQVYMMRAGGARGFAQASKGAAGQGDDDPNRGQKRPRQDCDETGEDKTDEDEVKNKQKRIKRPMNSFMVWGTVKRLELKSNNPQLSNIEISKRLGKQWKAMSAVERKPYCDQAEQVSLQHKKDHPGYKYSPRRRRRIEPPQLIPIEQVRSPGIRVSTTSTVTTRTAKPVSAPQRRNNYHGTTHGTTHGQVPTYERHAATPITRPRPQGANWQQFTQNFQAWFMPWFYEWFPVWFHNLYPPSALPASISPQWAVDPLHGHQPPETSGAPFEDVSLNSYIQYQPSTSFSNVIPYMEGNPQNTNPAPYNTGLVEAEQYSQSPSDSNTNPAPYNTGLVEAEQYSQSPSDSNTNPAPYNTGLVEAEQYSESPSGSSEPLVINYNESDSEAEDEETEK